MTPRLASAIARVETAERAHLAGLLADGDPGDAIRFRGGPWL